MAYLILGTLFLPFVPWLVVRYVLPTPATRQLAYKTHAPYLWMAAAAWAIGFFIPDIHISAETDTFQLHFFGGVCAAFLYEYVVRAYRLRFDGWWQPILMLYFFACGLGVANELFEFFLAKTRIMSMSGADTWWDLVANTSGVFTAFVVIRLLRRPKL